MADLQKDKNGKNIVYPGTKSGDDIADSANKDSSLYLFLNGGVGSDGQNYPKVDMSLYDYATMCATCHVGGAFYEHDRNGVRLPVRALMDMESKEVNPFTSTVWESFDASGKDTSFATSAPWIYPQYKGNDPTKGAMMAPYGWGRDMTMKDPNTGVDMPVVAGQLMTPNVKEMDCLFCHLKGYDNVMASVMTQAGAINSAPGAGAGLFDLLQPSPTYKGYNGYDAAKNPYGTVTFTRLGAANATAFGFANYSSHELVSLTAGMIDRIKPQPEVNNCLQCHATKTMKNFPELFGTTGTSAGFLSSAPMIYDPANGFGPLGKRMVAYDINSVWLQSGTSPVINYGNFMSYMMPQMVYPQAEMPTPFNAGNATDPMFVGGGNPAKMGPMFYYNKDISPDQNVLKRSVPVFARAEWFKRGDAWQDGQDLHSSFGCAGCHFTGDTMGDHKNQCDPGRGFDMASGIEDGVPPLVKRKLVTTRQGGFSNYSGLQTPAKHDTRNTVKRCEFCHITGKDYYGNPINTFGAPDPSAKHQAYRLDGGDAVQVQIVDKMDMHGTTYGGQGVSAVTNFTTPKQTALGRGNHLDVMDCTVCHVQKKDMTVRALDCTSGMRFPAVEGTDPAKGMMGLFEDPAPDSFNAGAVDKYNGMYTYMNNYFGYTGGEVQGALCAVDSQAYKDAGNQQVPGPGYQNMIPAGTHVVGGPLREWKPLHLWQKLGNMEAPLTIGNGGASQLKFRRKIYLSNSITALLWNNTSSDVDANGDSVPGGDLIGDNDEFHRPVKDSLKGYTDVFDGESPHKNNTQGYGEPIYDPWIMHDLKAGMNFGPSALSVISIGFGGFGTPAEVDDPTKGTYQSAYMPDGTFTGAFKYASIWSGAIYFTEPDQIRDYKAYRNAIEAKKPAALQRPWTGTELAVAGAPFMVTHGVKPVSQYVKGKSCADCHAKGAGFFDGGFNMLGTGIPADRTFNPTAQLSTTQDSNGDFVRNPGVPGLESASNLMERPLEPFRIKAYKGDLRTFFEGFNKLGQPRTVKFEATDGTYTWTTPLNRGDLLYPPDDNAIYYKITDVDAGGMPLTGAVPMTGAQYAAYLDTISEAPAAEHFFMTISGVADITACGTLNNPCSVNAGTIDFGAANDLGSLKPDVSYTWTFSDDTSANTTGATATRTISSVKTFTANLQVKNNSTGAILMIKKIIKTQSAVTTGSLGAVYGTTSAPVIVSLTALPTHTRLFVTWGDGTQQSIASVDANTAVSHRYQAVGTYNIAINIVNGSVIATKKAATATITAVPYAVSIGAHANGKITHVGSAYSFPADPGYHLTGVTVNNVPVTVTAGTYTFGTLDGNKTIAATFDSNFTAGTVTHGDNSMLAISGTNASVTPGAGYHVERIMLNGVTILDNTSALDLGAKSVALTGSGTVTASVGPNVTLSVTGTTPTMGTVQIGGVDAAPVTPVLYGHNLAYTVTTAADYHVNVTGGPSFTNVTVPQTIAVVFGANLTVTPPVNGTITYPGTLTDVPSGGSKTFTITPAGGFHTTSITATGANTFTINPTGDTVVTFSTITAPHTIAATFAADIQVIDNTINPTLHGSITSIGTNLYTVAADPGYTTTLITVTDNTTGDVTHPAGPIVDLRAAIHASTISATFTPTVTASTISFNGSISPFGATAVAEAASQVYTITPFPNYHVSSVMVGATVATATEIRGSCTINSGVATCTVYGAATPQIIQASFAGNINVSKTGNGNISNAGLVYTFNADFGNHVAEVKVDGAVVAGAPSSYTFADAAPHTLAVTFAVDIVPTIMSVSVVPNNGTITIDNVTHIATITPFESYYIEKVTVDGTDLPTAVSSYDFSGLAAGAHTITATFTAL